MCVRVCVDESGEATTMPGQDYPREVAAVWDTHPALGSENFSAAEWCVLKDASAASYASCLEHISDVTTHAMLSAGAEGSEEEEAGLEAALDEAEARKHKKKQRRAKCACQGLSCALDVFVWVIREADMVRRRTHHHPEQ